MASSSSSLLILVIFVSFPSVAFTQDPFSSSTSSGSDMLNCGPQLLALAPCASFVQGSIPSPSQTCCNNLYDLFDQQPNCLCVLLNETSFTSFPINRTLAFQLPNLCRVAMNISSACPGLTILPGSPESQTSPGPNANSSAVASSPRTASAPASSMGFGFGRNAGENLKTRPESFLLVIGVYLLIDVFNRF